MFFLKRHLLLFLVILLSFFSIFPLFSPGFFPMHDDTQVARVYEMGKALKDGMFPVRWVSDLGYGYGYPIFNFYAPLSYYIGGLFNVLGFDALAATKIMIGSGVLLSGLFMYFLAKEFFGRLGGLAAGLFYLYAPYHALDIYVRGDVAEFWAYAFIPLMFWGFYRVFKEKYQISNIKFPISNFKWIAVASLGYAGVILSHNLTAMMVTPFLLVVILSCCYIAVKNKKLLAICHILYAVFLGLLLSAFYWLPALLEMKYTNVFSQIGEGADFRDHFVCPGQLWDSLWGFGGSTKGCIDGMSFKVGKLHLFLTVLSAFFTAVLLIKPKILSSCHNDLNHDIKRTFMILFSLLGFFTSIFLTLEVSKPVWEAFFLMAFFQYPWRFLILVSFFSSFLAGFFIYFSESILNKFNSYIKYVPAVLALFVLLYFNVKLFKPQTIFNVSSDNYIDSISLKTSKVSDEYMPRDFNKPENISDLPKSKIEIVDGVEKVDVRITEDKTQRFKALITSENRAILKINIASFPSWKFYINEKRIEAKETNSGYIIAVPKGENRLIAKFQSTGAQKTANLLSITGLLLLFIGIIFPKLSYGKKS